MEENEFLENCDELLSNCKGLLDKLKVMKADVEFLQEEYRKNKRYFCSEGSKPSIDDIIKTVYEFAWASCENYNRESGEEKREGN